MNLTSLYLSTSQFEAHIERQTPVYTAFRSNNVEFSFDQPSVFEIYANKVLKDVWSEIEPIRVKGGPGRHIDLIKGSIDNSHIDQQLSMSAFSNAPNQSSNFLRMWFEKLKTRYDLILIDQNGSLSSLNKYLLGQCDFIISPLETDSFSRITFRLLNWSFYGSGVNYLGYPKLIGFILNKVSIIDGDLTVAEENGKLSLMDALSEMGDHKHMSMEITSFLGHLEKFTPDEQQRKVMIIDYIINEGISRSVDNEETTQYKRRKQTLYFQLRRITVNLLKSMVRYI